MFPPISCELLMGSGNQISAWSRREVADHGCFYVNLELHTTQEFITGEMALQRLTPAFSGAANGNGGRISSARRGLRCNALLDLLRCLSFYSIPRFIAD